MNCFECKDKILRVRPLVDVCVGIVESARHHGAGAP
jgi:hypothetical protein